MNNEEKLLNDRQFRDQNIGRYEILDKVKQLLLIPGTDLATVKQVAEFYEVGIEAVKAICLRHKSELEEDGIRLYNYKEFLKLQHAPLEKRKGKSVLTYENGETLEVPNRGLKVFPRRAILRVGMLLRDSAIAAEVRTQLLNIEEKASNETKTADIDEEQKLLLSVGMAYGSGDINAIMVSTTEYNGFKNRQIDKLKVQNEALETTNKALANGILEWEDRSRLNFAVRKLAKTSGIYYAKMWNELYKQLKNKYHIDVKARVDKNFISAIKENEWEYVIKSFSALCKFYKKEPVDMFNDLVVD